MLRHGKRKLNFVHKCCWHVIKKVIWYVTKLRIFEYSHNLFLFFFKVQNWDSQNRAETAAWKWICNFVTYQITFLMICQQLITNFVPTETMLLRTPTSCTDFWFIETFFQYILIMFINGKWLFQIYFSIFDFQGQFHCIINCLKKEKQGWLRKVDATNFLLSKHKKMEIPPHDVRDLTSFFCFPSIIF